MEPDLVAPTIEAIRRWSGIEPPNAAARRGLADLATLLAEVEAVRADLAFEDEPCGFDAALQAPQEPAA